MNMRLGALCLILALSGCTGNNFIYMTVDSDRSSNVGGDGTASTSADSTISTTNQQDAGQTITPPDIGDLGQVLGPLLLP